MKVLVAVVLLISFAEWSTSVKVTFYGKPDYVDFQDEISLVGEQELTCYNFPKKINTVSSIKTNKCIMVYADSNCNTINMNDLDSEPDRPFSERIDQDTPRLNNPLGVFSFHVCSQKLGGGSQLDIDFYRAEFKKENFLRSYHGVCSCTNIAAETRQYTFALDNHGNKVNIYSEENCAGQPGKVPAGDNFWSRHLQEFKKMPKSFEPVDLQNCYKLQASITKFHFRNGTESGIPRNIQFAKDSILKNNGPTEITDIFRAKRVVTETVEYSIAESFTKMESGHVETNVEMSAEVGVPLLGSSSVSASIGGGYEWSSENGGGKTNTTTITTETSSEIEQQVKVPPCKRCVVSSFIKMVKEYPVKYTATAKISGEGEDRISAEVIKKNLPPGFEYVRTIDEYTIEGTTEGTMMVEFGMETSVEVNCDPGNLPGCEPTAYNHSDDHQKYVIPIRGRPTLKGAPVQYSRARRSTFVSFLQNAFGLAAKHLN